jgi:hypothetical protein
VLSNRIRNLSNFLAAIFTTAPSHTDWTRSMAVTPPVLPSTQAASVAPSEQILSYFVRSEYLHSIIILTLLMTRILLYIGRAGPFSLDIGCLRKSVLQFLDVPGSDLRPGDWLVRVRIFMVFLNPSGLVLG